MNALSWPWIASCSVILARSEPPTKPMTAFWRTCLSTSSMAGEAVCRQAGTGQFGSGRVREEKGTHATGRRKGAVDICRARRDEGEEERVSQVARPALADLLRPLHGPRDSSGCPSCPWRVLRAMMGPPRNPSRRRVQARPPLRAPGAHAALAAPHQAPCGTSRGCSARARLLGAREGSRRELVEVGELAGPPEAHEATGTHRTGRGSRPGGGWRTRR